MPSTDQQLSSPSVDPAEIEKFNRLAEIWWDAEGAMWPLHRLNQLRIGYIVDQITSFYKLPVKTTTPLAGVRLLDIGCGGGLLSEAMAQSGAEVHGIDIPEKNIHIAKQHADGMENQPVYEQVTAESLAQRNQTYDVVLNMEVVEHVADLPSFMTACNSLVKPGGIQIISTINRNPIAGISAIFGAEYVLKWLPKGTHQYRKLVKPRELQQLCTKDGFKQLTTTGVGVNPVSKKMSLRRSRMISYMLVLAKAGQLQ